MRILVARGTLTKDETYRLGELLMRAGYEVSIRKAAGKKAGAVTYINLRDPDPVVDEEDLS